MVGGWGPPPGVSNSTRVGGVPIPQNRVYVGPWCGDGGLNSLELEELQGQGRKRKKGISSASRQTRIQG